MKNGSKQIALLVFILITLITSLSQAQILWVREQAPTQRILNSCHFLDYNTGWIAGDSGLILRTTNAGSNWEFQASNIFENIEKIFFVNERIGYALAYNLFPDSTEYLGTIILKTSNGGDDWERTLFPQPERFFRDIFFIDSTTGFMAGSPIAIVKTTNAGTSWFFTDADTLNAGLPVFSVRFINSLTGYASGGFRDIAGTVWRSTDGGLHWISTLVGPEPLVDIHILNPSKAIAVGGDFEFGSSYVKTENGGLNWFYDTLGVFGVALAVDFRTPLEGWLSLGTSQKFAYTLDGGVTYTNLFTPDSIIVTDIDFTDSLHGWAVGYFGALLRYDGTMSSVNISNEPFAPDDFVLHQNFPNPFNPETKIRYKLNRNGFVDLRMFDSSGKEVRHMVNTFQNSGEYELFVDARDLPSGVYWCKMSFGESGKAVSQNIKLVLLK